MLLRTSGDAGRGQRPGRADGRIYRKVSYGPLVDIFLIDMRTYRGPNTANVQPEPSGITALLGRPQLRWLQRSLAASRATWKIVASDMPVGLAVPDGGAFDAVANADDGDPLGREHEMATLLRWLARRDVRNVVWLTADVHYTAAHHYAPSRASFAEFLPFWEFVSGPLHAGSFGPNELDATFGPRVVFQEVAPQINAPPSAGYQFYGVVDVSAPPPARGAERGTRAADPDAVGTNSARRRGLCSGHRGCRRKDST